MNCGKARKWMSLATDNELEASRLSLLESHLAGCAACRAESEAWSQFGNVLREPGREAGMTAEAMWQSVQRDIRVSEDRKEAGRAPAWPGLFPRSAIVTACLVLICVGVLWLAPPSEKVEEQDVPGIAGVESVETDLSDATLIVYKDEVTDAVVVWVTGENGGPVRNDHS